MSNNKDIWNWEKDIDRIFKKWLTNTKNVRTDKYLNSEIRSINRLIKNLIQEGIDPEEVLEVVVDGIYDTGVKYSELSNSLDDKLYQLESVKYLTNKEVLEKKYDEYLKREGKHVEGNEQIIDSNIERSSSIILEEAIKIIKEDKKYSRIKYVSDNMVECLGHVFYDTTRTLEEDIKNQQIEIMECIGAFLDQTGTLKKYLSIHNSSNSNIDGVNFKYKYKSEGPKDEIGLRDIFTREYLEKQDLEHIEALSVFWQNRFAKQLKSYNKGLFIASQLSDRKEELKEDCQWAPQKLLLLERLCTCIDVNIKSNLESYIDRNLSDEENKDNVSNEVEQIIRCIEEKYGVEYQNKMKTIKDDIMDSKISDEITIYLNSLSAMKNVYSAKTALLAHMMRGLKNKKYSENWGVMKEADGGINRYVLIGIDIEKFNMPLRLHLKKEELEDLSVGEIPDYLGSEDFKDMRTNVLMPLNRRQIKEIITELKKKPKNKRLLHLRYLSKREKKPEHLKEKAIVEDNEHR